METAKVLIMDDKENVVYKQNGALLNYKEGNYIICGKMDGTGDHHIK
jgi:hypothetical protein